VTPPLNLPDRELCDWLEQEAAFIASNFDQSRCTEFARVLNHALERGRIEIRPVSKPELKSGEAFKGRPMEASFGGRCAVCTSAFPVGAPIVYSREMRAAAHLGCGQPEARR
jgi:hypothetical protein